MLRRLFCAFIINEMNTCMTNTVRKRVGEENNNNNNKKDPRGTLRFWGVKFNGIMIVFVGGQIFNWFTGQKAQPEPLLHSLSQLKLSTLDKPSGQKTSKNHSQQLSLTEGHYFWQMTDIFALSKVGRKAITYYLSHFVCTHCSQQTVFISSYQRDLLF